MLTRSKMATQFEGRENQFSEGHQAPLQFPLSKPNKYAHRLSFRSFSTIWIFL